MKAAFIENGAIKVDEMPEPVPARGQALVRRPWLCGRIGLGQVADAVAGMSGPLAPVRHVVDPRPI